MPVRFHKDQQWRFQTRISRSDVPRKTGEHEDHVGELAAHPHDLVRVPDSFEILPAGSVALRRFSRHKLIAAYAVETGREYSAPLLPNVELMKYLRESLGLRLGADKKGDAEHHAAQAEQHRAFAMRKKTHRNVEGGVISMFAAAGADHTLPHRLAIPQSILISYYHVIALANSAQAPP